MRTFSSRLLTVAPFFFSSVFCTAVITSFTNLSLPLDDSDLECPLPSRELRLPSQCKYNEDGSGYITSCGPVDGFTGKSVNIVTMNVAWTRLLLSNKESNWIKCGVFLYFTGSVIINENATHRVWNFTLGPGSPPACTATITTTTLLSQVRHSMPFTVLVGITSPISGPAARLGSLSTATTLNQPLTSW